MKKRHGFFTFLALITGILAMLIAVAAYFKDKTDIFFDDDDDDNYLFNDDLAEEFGNNNKNPDTSDENFHSVNQEPEHKKIKLKKVTDKNPDIEIIDAI